MNNRLYCDVQECIHNYNQLCSANSINILGDQVDASDFTKCGSFQKKGFINAISNIVNTNVPGGIRQLFNGKSVEMHPNIQCEAIRCTYNVDKRCDADNVQIYGANANSFEGTKCKTFRL